MFTFCNVKMEQELGGEIKTSLLDNSNHTHHELKIFVGQEDIME